MKPKLYLFLAVIGIFVFASCEKTQTFEDLHKIANEAAFAKIAASSDYTKIESQSKAGFIMYKELTDGNGAIPIFSDQVKVLYTGWYKNDWTKGDTYTDDNGNLIKNKVIFDSTTERGDIPSLFKVSGLVDGFTTALQYMEVGDKWEVWIPWKLGYGSTASGTIPAYTTLVFEIELVEVL
ncbi:MAG: FKBP-type peptidyl-prolyl cis-trans isomerase [Petrimonas sp.]|nr:FKBP-type peptidyl-prolyl cis-trans isomerase [Petrimonas sp.]